MMASSLQRKKACWFFLLLLLRSDAQLTAESELKISTPVPVNMAEAIIEPFFDPQISEFSKWNVVRKDSIGLELNQFWCWLNFEWVRKPANGPAMSMSKSFNLDCSGYDKLLLSAVVPKTSVIRILAQTNKGKLELVSSSEKELKQEYSLDLEGATSIRKITIEIVPGQDGMAVGWFNWLGLQNSKLLPRYLKQWQRFDQSWEGYLKSESYEPSFKPSWGIVINESELDDFREYHQEMMETDGRSFVTEAAKEALQVVPEQQINEFVNYGDNKSYVRNRDYGKVLVGKYVDYGADAAVAGLILKDKTLLRLAARYAMSIAMCREWQDSMLGTMPGGLFDHRCFVASLNARQIAIILDLAGEMFTEAGRELVLRRLTEEGINSISYTVWKHDYVFHCNQLAWFTPGRIYGYVAMEREWSRVKPYTDMAFGDLCENIDNTIAPDGSFAEGPRYFVQFSKDVARSTFYYSRSREREFLSSVPERFKATGRLAEVLESTDDSQDLIPICDGNPRFPEDESISFLATLMPNSRWVAIYHKLRSRDLSKPRSLLAIRVQKEIPDSCPPPQEFIELREMGAIASTRKLDGEAVKILIPGNKAGTLHAHEDKGSFVLEFAGDTFAMDPGICEYGHPLSLEYKHCQRHNMLVPTGVLERPAPQNPLQIDVKPVGKGDDVLFVASIDATPGWEPFYKVWERKWESPGPDEFTITDRYELNQGSGVEFYWQTTLPVKLENRVISITGRRGVLRLYAQSDCKIRVDSLKLYNGNTQNRVAICRQGSKGELSVRVELSRRQINDYQEN